MPIRPENKDRYPDDWPDISRRIRFDRAEGRCECAGECGAPTHSYPGRCLAEHGQAHPVTGSRVVLTVAHLNHTPEDCTDDNLRAMCQACHLSYDIDRHVANAARTRLQNSVIDGQLSLEDALAGGEQP